ncbi:MAG TPA: hypothetical protein V6C81_09835 [Planktothrix sp.]|jgi:Spy/CpxP family protein refolding chaperone
MKGITKAGIALALFGGATICAINAQPAEAHDHWYHERAARHYWHEERWMAHQQAMNNYYYNPYAAPVMVQPAPMYRRVIY